MLFPFGLVAQDDSGLGIGRAINGFSLFFRVNGVDKPVDFSFSALVDDFRKVIKPGFLF